MSTLKLVSFQDGSFVKYKNSFPFVILEQGTTFKKRCLLIVKDNTLLINLLKKGYMEGNIVIKESTKPFFEGQLPYTKSDGTLITSKGKPVFQNKYISSDLNKKDKILIKD
jgi:hypothetical protein